MKYLILTLADIPDDHDQHCLVKIEGDLYECSFSSSLNFERVSNPRIPFNHPVFDSPWKLTGVKTMLDLLNHPLVITYTPESHPEYFI